MPRVDQDSIPISLHYALTDSQCSKCGGHLEWKADFDDINQPKYVVQPRERILHMYQITIVSSVYWTLEDKKQKQNVYIFLTALANMILLVRIPYVFYHYPIKNYILFRRLYCCL